MHSDYEPILINTPKDFSEIVLYPLHDLHKGNAYFNQQKWDAVKSEILAAPNRYCVVIGDAMENAIPGSASSVFESNMHPFEQKEWVTQQFVDLHDRILAVVDGNHERNRSTKFCDMHPLFDCCVLAGIGDKFRSHFAVADIGVGTRRKDPNQQTHYVVFAIHKAKNLTQWASCDWTENTDIFLTGHTHNPLDVPRGKLVYDTKLKQVSVKTCEFLNNGSFVDIFGGYGADNGYRPSAQKLYKLILNGADKRVQTVGYYV